MKNRNLLESFKNAFNGIKSVAKSERNMKIHLLATVLVLMLSFFLKLSGTEFLAVCITIAIVLICEIFNTVTELLVDIIVDVYHPKAKIIKDMAAGAVLISAVMSLVVAYIIFFDKIMEYIRRIL